MREFSPPIAYHGCRQMKAGIRPSSVIFVAGARGLVGSAIVRRLCRDRFARILAPTRNELDLRDPHAVEAWFKKHKPEFVFLAAGKVGGILANSTRPAEFLYDNLMIHSTVIPAAHRHGTQKLLYLGSSCIYPRNCPQPMREEYFMTGPLEPTNSAYALAKIAGIQMCRAFRKQHGCNFISAMPSNLYGPGDNFDLKDGHALPALMRRFHEAKLNAAESVTVWGSGRPRREFLHVDDLADACLFLMRSYDGEEHVNIGTGTDVTIKQLAGLIRILAAPEVKLEWDRSKPDGIPRKLLDTRKLKALGWVARIPLEEGLRTTYRWFSENYDQAIRSRSHPAATA